jgi:GT2 family glycosyltransferase
MAEPLLDLTIIIPSYNTRDLLRNCLKSIYQHSRGITFEVICIDDASTDGSADMVSSNFPEVVLVRNTVVHSYARNNNTGMGMSRARYACLLNSDTQLISNAFEALVRFMDECPEAATCGPKLLNPDMSVQHCIRRFAGPNTFFLQTLNWHKLFPRSRWMDRYYATDFDYSQPQQVESIGTTAYMIRRSTWEQAGMLDERFRVALADLAYNYMLKQKGYKVFYTPCAEVIHYGGQSINQVALSAFREQCESFIKFNDCYDYFGKSRLTKAIVRFGIRVRYCSKVLGYYLSSDKRVIKGPGAPRKEVAAQADLARNFEVNTKADTGRTSSEALSRARAGVSSKA